MKALILAAGKGTRLGKLTKDTPKVMLRVGGKPCLEHLVNHLNSFGITEIIVNLHHKPKVIMDYFGTRLLYFYEPKLLGEEGTIEALEEWLGSPFVVMNGDTLTNVNINEMKAQLRRSLFAGHIEFHDGVPAGTWIYKWLGGLKRLYGSDAFWFDIGSLEGLKKARKHYAKRIDYLPKLRKKRD